MLCLDCGNGLRNAYILVEKALVSDLKLKNHKCEIIADSLLKFEKEEVISVDRCNMINSEQTLAPELNLKDQQSQIIAENRLQFKKELIIDDTQNSLNPTIEYTFNTNKDEEGYISTETITVNTLLDEELHDVSIQNSGSASESGLNKNTNINSKSEKKPKKKKILTLLCSHCPKIFHTKAHLIRHEETHVLDRKRTEVCTICSLKFYCKNTLQMHMDIHDENRKRKHKCEFCPKAFFARGGLNIHRRIHLGQMIKCNFCPKEFYRQVDLDQHMKSHDVTPLTSNTGIEPRVRAKYFRKCDFCGNKINTSDWKHHRAKHLNQPTLQCLICSKTFFPNSKVTRHLRQCHDIQSDECDKFLIKLDNKFEPRLSSLMIEQKITEVYTEK
ncbi:zinc finger protein 39-like isoform X2 [Lucilia sericata]|nr:zinc finger protein 39-like isoform X2 [Lucilia sericata]